MIIRARFGAAKHAGITRVFDLQQLTRTTASNCPTNDTRSPVDVHRDIATLTYSNVATDVPMGVMLSHHNLVANVVQTGSVEPIEGDEVLVGLMPFCQLYGMVTVNVGLSAGASIVTLPQFTLRSLMTAMARYHVTTAFLVPAIIRTLSKHAVVDRHAVSALRHIVSLTAPLPESVGRACADKWTGLQATTRAYAKIIDEVNKRPLTTFQRPEEPVPTR